MIKLKKQFFLKETFCEETSYKCSEKAAKYTGIDKGQLSSILGFTRVKLPRLRFTRLKLRSILGFTRGDKKTAKNTRIYKGRAAKHTEIY